jgi:hypothetical protein
LLVASGAVLVFKPLPSIKIWYAFGVLSKKKIFAVLALNMSSDDTCAEDGKFFG